MEEILISIIVPAYNIEQYIGRCLDSILNQTHKKLQIIVVNDGSFDKTGEILDRYAVADNRISVIHKSNGGVSSARIVGIEMALGEYIGFVDGDDYIEPNMYKVLLKNAVKYQADISHCGYKMVFPDGHEDLYYGTGKVVESNNKDGLKNLIDGEFVEPGLWNKLYHASLVKGFFKEAIWDSTIKINEDLLMNYILFKRAKKSIYEDKTFYHYMLRKGSAAISNKHHYKIADPLKVVELIKNDIDSDDELYNVIYCRYLRLLINMAMQNEWREDATKAKRLLKAEVIKSDFSKFCNSRKLKLMAFGVAYLHPLYKVVRYMYDRKTGISKKYEIN